MTKLDVAHTSASKRSAPAAILDALSEASTYLAAVIKAGATAKDQLGPLAFKRAIGDAQRSLEAYAAWG